MQSRYTIQLGLTLTEHQDGFSFGTDALLLSAFVRPKRGGTAVDLGCGSGVISLLLQKRESFARVYAVDILPAYTEKEGIVAQNVAQNGLEGRIVPLCADAKDLRAQTLCGEVDCVFTNPPYFTVTQGRLPDSDARRLARHQGQGSVYDFCAAAGRLLKYGGACYAVYTPEYLPDLFFAMRGAGIEPKHCVLVCDDAQHPPFAVLVEGKKGGKARLRTQVLCLYDEAGEPTPIYAQIQQQGVWNRCQRRTPKKTPS